MSAFLCTPRHIGQLVSYYCADRNHRNRIEDPATLATTLARANLQSVGYRYEMNEDQTAADMSSFRTAGGYIAACIAEAKRPVPPTITPIAVIKMVACLNYQSCEVEGWQETEAYNLLEKIERSAHSRIHGWSDAPWGEYVAPERPAGLRVMP